MSLVQLNAGNKDTANDTCTMGLENGNVNVNNFGFLKLCKKTASKLIDENNLQPINHSTQTGKFFK